MINVRENIGFRLTDDEQMAYDKWKKKHFDGVYFGAIGGGTTWEFIQTSIGEIITAKCMGKEIVLRELK